MRPQFSKLIASVLLGIFSVFLIPKEFVHALYGHTDTHEIVSVGSDKTIGAHHIHCGFLTYEASLFTIASSTHCPDVSDFSFSFTAIPSEQAGVTFACHPSLRGPPALV
jgi:hypothetical protein